MIRAAASVLALLAGLATPAYAAHLVNQGQTLTVQVHSDVPDDPPIIPPSGGGGGSSSANAQTGVTVSGRAYPLSRVSVLRDGSVAATTIAGPDASFSVTLSRISSGTHTISVRSADAEGRESTLFSFPLTVTAGAMTTVSGIFIAPTIDLDKIQVKQGDPIAVFGQTSPTAQVTITVHSDQVIEKKVVAQNDGTYLYYLDSTPLAMGDHTAQSFSGTSTVLSPLSTPLPFKVGTENILSKSAPKVACVKADINCDTHVDLVDYSILAYWYQRPGAPAKVDLNGDGQITLIDLSILAYYWTG